MSMLLNVIYVENSFKFYNFKNCDSKLTLKGLQDIIATSIEVPVKDQLILKQVIQGGETVLQKQENPDDFIFGHDEGVSILPKEIFEERITWIVLVNNSITSEANLKDL